MGLFDSISLFLIDVDDDGSVEFSINFDSDTSVKPKIFNIAVYGFEKQQHASADLSC